MSRVCRFVDTVNLDELERIWELGKDEVIANQGDISLDTIKMKFTEVGSSFIEGRNNGAVTGYIAGIRKRNGTYLLTNSVTETPTDFGQYSAEPMHILLKAEGITHVMAYCKDGSSMLTFVENNLNRSDLYKAGSRKDHGVGFYQILVEVL
jgi:hypothetical protein